MTGLKLNEGALLIPEGQTSVKATAKYLRGSASKAREVLDLIRGLDVRRADEVLQFTTRDVAKDVRKVLASAVANAVHNEGQDAEELFVLAAFADEGPTLKRFKARARGRGTRIRKRTSHITVVVARLSDERLEVLQNKQQTQTAAGRRRAGTSAQGRRDRVQRSRARAEGLREGTAETVDTDVETPASDVDVVDGQEILAAEVEPDAAEATEAPEIQGFADVTDTEHADTEAADREQGEAEPSTEASEASPSDTASEASPSDTASPSDAEIELPAGAVAAPADGSIPAGYEIKGNLSSKKYHVPGGRYYDITIAEVFFDSAESAEAAGYEAPAADKDDA